MLRAIFISYKLLSNFTLLFIEIAAQIKIHGLDI